MKKMKEAVFAPEKSNGENGIKWKHEYVDKA